MRADTRYWIPSVTDRGPDLGAAIEPREDTLVRDTDARCLAATAPQRKDRGVVEGDARETYPRRGRQRDVGGCSRRPDRHGPRPARHSPATTGPCRHLRSPGDRAGPRLGCTTRCRSRAPPAATRTCRVAGYRSCLWVVRSGPWVVPISRVGRGGGTAEGHHAVEVAAAGPVAGEGRRPASAANGPLADVTLSTVVSPAFAMSGTPRPVSNSIRSKEERL